MVPDVRIGEGHDAGWRNGLDLRGEVWVMSEVNYIVSLSGGKDSIATALIMSEHGIPIHSCAHFMTGWDFPQITDMVDRLESYLGVKVARLEPKYSLEYQMLQKPIISKKGHSVGKVHRTGNGWPSPLRRWCTGRKVGTIDRYSKLIEEQAGKISVQCIGFAYDEQHRVKKSGIVKKIENGRVKFPLIEKKITEKEALQICYRHGFDFGGLYHYFSRVSCWCCPLQSLQDLRTIRRFFPQYWAKMLVMDGGNSRDFQKYQGVHDLECRFASEDRMGRIHDEEHYEVMAPCEVQG